MKYVFIIVVSMYAGAFLNEHKFNKQQCTEKCQVKELELQNESDELKWRYELINDIKK